MSVKCLLVSMMKIMKKLRDSPASSVFIMVLFLVFWFRDVLIFETLSVSHDGVKAYPFFHYLVQNIQQGIFPLWSPTTHCGEPFWTYIQIVGLTNPIFTIASIIAVLFKLTNLSILYHWSVFVASIVFNVGVVLIANSILRRSHRAQLHWVTTPIIFMGSMSMLSWGQVFGLTFTVTWFPLLVWFLLEMFRHLTLQNFKTAYSCGARAGLCFAFQLCSFNPSFVGISLTVYAIFFGIWVVTHIKEYRLFHFTSHTPIALLVFILTTFIFSLPMLKFLQYQKQFFPIARADSARYYPQKVHYGNSWIPLTHDFTDDIGTSAKWRDFYTLTGRMGTAQKPKTSELPIILGPFGLLLAYFGLLCFRNVYYLLLAPPTVLLALLSLGAKAKLSIIFYNLFPLFSFIRHLEFFLGFVFFGFALLMVIGLLEFEKIFCFVFNRGRLSRKIGQSVLAVLFLVGVLLSPIFLKKNAPPNLQSIPRVLQMRFPYAGDRWSNERVQKVGLIRPTSFFRDDYISQAEPLLLYKDSARFYDNATQFIMPAKYWEFIKSKNPQADQKGLEDPLGVRMGKVRITGPSGLIAFSIGEYNANRLVMDVDVPEGSRLFYSQNKVPGWIVRINGEKQIISDSVNHTFFDFVLPKGKLRIEFSYRPKDIELAYGLHYMGQLMFLVLSILPLVLYKHDWITVPKCLVAAPTSA